MSDEQPPTRILHVGIHQAGPGIELRFVLEPWGWRPDLIVDHNSNSVRKPPECFKPTGETLLALEEAYIREIADEAKKLDLP